MSPSAALFESGSRTRRRGPFLSRQERSQRNASPDGATPPARTRLCFGGVPTGPPCPGGPRARSFARPFRLSVKGLRRLGAPYGAQPQNHGSFMLQPRRRASVEDRPKSSPTGHRRDSVRAHTAQGCAVCAPPEADEDARDRRSRRSLSGQDGFGDFPQKESHPGVQGAERPASSRSTSPQAIQQ